MNKITVKPRENRNLKLRKLSHFYCKKVMASVVNNGSKSCKCYPTFGKTVRKNAENRLKNSRFSDIVGEEGGS